MSTKLLPVDSKIIKWTFPEDVEDKDAIVFHIKLRSNRDRIKGQMAQAAKLIQTDEDFANDCYGENITQIDNVEGKNLKDRKEIVNFCLDRLSENQGSSLQLAIQNRIGYIDKGLVKN